jgi:hypothetical protein
MPTKRKRPAKRAPAAPTDFATQVAAYVAALDPGGAVKAAQICGVTRRTIDLWQRATIEPNRATRMGALGLLALHIPREGGPPDERA